MFLFVVPTPLGIFLAVLLDRELRGTRFYQSALFLPVVLSLALVGFIWQLIYSRDQGLLNAVLGTADRLVRRLRASTSGRCWSPPAGSTPATSCCSTWPG